MERRAFEHLLGALGSAGLVEVEDASFTKGGERIEFQRVRLTEEGSQKGIDALGYVPVSAEAAPRPKKRKKGEKKVGAKDPDAARRAFFAKRARRGKKR